MVPKINDPATMPFKKMENIANYLKAVRSFGMKEFEMFGTPDLYDAKNVMQVVTSTHALGRLVQAIMPEGAFPKLGIKVVEKNVSHVCAAAPPTLQADDAHLTRHPLSPTPHPAPPFMQERHFSEEQMVQARMAVSVINLGSSDMGKKAFADVLAGEGFNPAGEKGEKGDKGAKGKEAAAPEKHAHAAHAAHAPTTETYAHAHTPTAPHAAKKEEPAKAAKKALPAGWEELATDDGELYYYNSATDETSWDFPEDKGKPAAAAAPAKEEPLPVGWEALQDEKGKTYFSHTSGQSSWTRPKPLPPGWEEDFDEGSNKWFYVNDATGKTTWTRPTA